MKKAVKKPQRKAVSTMPYVCIERRLPDVTALQTTDHRASIALLKSRVWPNGSSIPVYLSSPTAAQKREVEAVIDELMGIVNLDIKLTTNRVASRVRVTFDRNGGAWSYIGTDALQQASNRATMNLGFNQGGTYMHEFGHMLGAIHEHQNPRGGIKWNKEQVIRDLSGPPNSWDRQTIEHNMFEAYSVTQLNADVFDSKSIMLYAIPASWTTDGFSSRANAVLSPRDRLWLKAQYPGRGGTEPTPIDNAIKIDVHDLSPHGEKLAEANERDLFAFEVVSGKTGRHIIETLGETPVNMQLFGPNSPTVLIKQTNNVAMSGNAVIDVDLSAAAVYFIQVQHVQSGGTGDYSVRVVRPTKGDTFGRGGANAGAVRGELVLPSGLGAGRFELRDFV